MKVLIVDDNADAVRLLTKQLDAAGYWTAWAHDAEAGWKALEECGADVVVLDIGLPGISGLALLEAIQTDSRFEALPVVIATGQDVDLVDDVLARPGVRVLVKPFVGVAEIEKAMRELGLADKMPRRGMP